MKSIIFISIIIFATVGFAEIDIFDSDFNLYLDREDISNYYTPQVIKCCQPSYPEAARISEREGIVLVEVKIKPNGKVSKARILNTFPSDSEGYFDRNVLLSAEKFIFAPYKKQSDGEELWTIIPYVFVSDENRIGNDFKISIKESGDVEKLPKNNLS